MPFDPSSAVLDEPKSSTGFDPSGGVELVEDQPDLPSGLVPYEAIKSAVRQEPPRQIAPIDIPDFGKEGSVARGISQVVTGLGEFVLNKPEEVAAAAFPPTSVAVALRYAPEILKQTGEDVYSLATKGDKEAGGRVLGTIAAVAAPIGAKKVIKHLAETPVEHPQVLPISEQTFQELIPESRRLAGIGIRMPEFQEGPIGPEPRTVAPESRQLPAPRTRMPEFTESTLEPEGPPRRALPAPGETMRPSTSTTTQNAMTFEEQMAGVPTGQTESFLREPINLPESPLGPRTAGYRIELPIEPEAAKAAREQWSKPPIDIEAEVTAIDALKQMVEIGDESKTPGQPYKPPTVNVDLRQLERMMQKNTVSKVESWADQVIKDKLSGTSANPFFDPEFLAAASVKGAILFKRGVVAFADWSAEMLKQFGRGIEGRLPAIYEQSKNYWEQRAKEVTNASKVGEGETVLRDVLRDAQEGKGTEALPLNEGQSGVRTEAEVNAPELLSPSEFAPKRGKIVSNPKAGWKNPTEPTHIEVDPVTGELFKGDPREVNIKIGDEGYFYRAGKLPESGFSRDYRDNVTLKGVSVYPTPDPTSFAGLKSADWYVGKGTVVGFGPDGEPLITPSGEWKVFSKASSDDRVSDAHRFHIKDAISNQRPVSVEAVNKYKIKLPENYIKQGDYFAPETKPPLPAAGATPESPAPAAEAVRGPSTSGVAASEVPPVIREATTESASAQLSPTEQAKLFTPEALATPKEKTVGLTPRTVSAEDVGREFGSFLRKHFTVEGHIPKDVWHGPKLEMEGKFSELNQVLRHREREFMSALGESYGLGWVKRLGGGLRRIPTGAVQLMDDYLKGKVFNPAGIPTAVRSVLDTMRAEITGKSNEIISMLTAQQNRLKVGSPGWESLNKLIETVKNNLDVYVNRSYEFFDSKSNEGQWYHSLPAGMRMAAEDLLITKSPTPLTRIEAQELLKDWLSDLKTGKGMGGGGKLGSKDQSIFMRRNVIEPEFRAILGEYRDPLINYAKSVTKMGEWVAKQKFLEDTKRIGMGSFLFEEGAPRPEGFNTLIAGKGSETMSPLNGLRTTPEIAKAFEEFYDTPTQNLAFDLYYKLNAATKMAATTHSWLTQMRNLLSRPIMALWAGHTNPKHAWTAIRTVWADAVGSSKKWQAYSEKLAKLGVVGDTARAGELRAIVKDAALQDIAPGSVTSWSVGKALKKLFIEVPQSIYRLSDEFGNVFGFENALVEQRKIHPTWTTAELEAAAAKDVRAMYPTYSETPGFVKGFRKVPLTGPFVTFSYQVYRTVWNGLAKSFTQIRSTNPTERALGYQRLGKQMAAVTLGYGLQEASKAFWNISTQQEDDFRRAQAFYNKNAKWLFTAGSNNAGRMSAVNLSYMDPFSYVTDPAVAIASAIRSDKDFYETFSATLKESLRPWISEQMLVQASIEARNGVSDSGREIWNITDTDTQKLEKGLEYIMQKAFYPGTIQRIQKRILPAARNEQPMFGRKLELGPEIFREATGIAIETTDFKTFVAQRAKDFVKNDRGSESIFYNMLSRTQTTTPEEILSAYQESDSRRQAIWKEMRKDFLAAVRNGVSESDARKTMMARGMTKEDARNIAQGRYKPLEISDQARKRATERGREIPRQAIRDYQQTARNISLDD